VARRTTNDASLAARPASQGNVTYFRLRTMGPIFLFFALFWANGNPAGRWVVPSVTSALALTLYAANRKSERPFSSRSALILALTGWCSSGWTYRRPFRGRCHSCWPARGWRRMERGRWSTTCD